MMGNKHICKTDCVRFIHLSANDIPEYLHETPSTGVFFSVLSCPAPLTINILEQRHLSATLLTHKGPSTDQGKALSFVWMGILLSQVHLSIVMAKYTGH